MLQPLSLLLNPHIHPFLYRFQFVYKRNDIDAIAAIPFEGRKDFGFFWNRSHEDIQSWW
jgi:hypothetical protein